MRRQSELRKKGLAVILSIALAAASFSGCGLKDVSKNIKTDVTAEAAAGEMDALEKEITDMIHSETAGKTETVYVIKDADGNNQKVIVSEWLKNPEGKSELSDVTTLKDIEVVKGDAVLSEGADGAVTWNGNGSDIYYRGSSDKALPVDVEVKYTLDGKEVHADDLNNVSGHLKIEFIYKNNTGKSVEGTAGEYTLYQPFLMVSGLILSNDKATDVKVSGGSAVNDGDRTIIFGMGFPGLTESIGLDNLEIGGEKLDIGLPESVSVECEVKNFSKPVTLTIATETALDALDLSDINGSQLAVKFMELKNGVNQLVDGSKALADGMGSLSEGGQTLTDGVNKLKDGADALSKGAGDLSDGAAKVNQGAKTLYDGTGELNSGAVKLDAGVKSLLSGMTELDNGAATLEWGLKTMQEKMPALQSGAGQLVKGAKDLSDGAKLLISNNDSLNNGISTLYAGLHQLNTSLNSAEAKQKLAALVKGNSDFKQGLNDFNTGIQAAVAGYDYTKLGYTKEQLQGLSTYLTNYANAIAGTDPVSAAYIEAAAQLVNGYVSMYDNLAKLGSGSDQLNAAYAELNNGVNTLIGQIQEIAGYSAAFDSGALELKNGIAAYTAGAKNVSDGAEKLSSGADQLSEVLPELKKGVDDLTDGAGKLKTGADQLKAGTAQLSDGSAALADGTKSLKDGAKQLSDGTAQLDSGSKALAEGADALDKGIGDLKDGSKDLIEGMGKLLDGSVALRDGVLKLNEEGIEKLTKFVNENLSVYVERFDKLKEYSAEFNSFAGVEENTKCQTVFVFKTE